MTNDLRVPLPEELEPFRADLEYFFSTMVRKLHVNRHKGTSKDMRVKDLVEAIKAETMELEQAIKTGGQFDAPIEACDVANFAFLTSMVIWHMTREEFERSCPPENYAKKLDVSSQTWVHRGSQGTLK